MWKTYSRSYLVSLGLQYVNTGFLALVDLVNNKLMDEYYNLSPSEATAVLSIAYLAWSPKIVYGFVIDQFPICGSRAKSYLLVCGFTQCAVCLTLALVPFEDPYIVAVFLLCYNFSIAIGDVVNDGLMVGQSRRDP